MPSPVDDLTFLVLCAAGAADFVGRKMGLCRVPHLLHELVVAGARRSRRVAGFVWGRGRGRWADVELKGGCSHC